MANRYVFRGKSKETGEWMYGSLMSFKGFSIFDPSLKQWVPVYGSTVGQCVGMDDINGNLIFEGDLVRASGRKTILLVTFVNFSYIVVNKNRKFVNWLERDIMYEIVGTIHDDSKLFEEDDVNE